MIPGIGNLSAVFGSSSTLTNTLQYYLSFDASSGGALSLVSPVNNTALQQKLGWSSGISYLTTGTKNGAATSRLGRDLYGEQEYISIADDNEEQTRSVSFFAKVVGYGHIFSRMRGVYDPNDNSDSYSEDLNINILTNVAYVSISGQSGGNTTITINNWNHYVVTFEASFYKVYINGNFICQGTSNVYSNYYPYTTGFVASFFGASVYYNSIADPQYSIDGPYTLHIDEIGVWNRLLTALEITELYNSGNGKFYPF